MKKRIIIGDAPRLGKKDFHVGLVTMDDYETSNETYALKQLSPEDLEAIPDIMEKLEKVSRGNSVAMWNRAVCYDCGISVESNLEKAKEYYMLAYMQAQLDQGSFKDVGQKEGEITAVNLLDTLDAYTEATQHNCPCAIYFAGMAFLNGLGVEENDRYAAFCFRISADCGVAEAHAALGNCFFRGYGVDQDVPRAIELFKKASNAGSASGALILGQIFWNAGMREAGLTYIRKAAAMGDDEAVELLKQIMK